MPGLTHRTTVSAWQARSRASVRARARPFPTLRHERKCWSAGDQVVVGIDEVGRGSWAGPVTVGAVVAPPTSTSSGVRDSKLLTPAEREVVRARACARGRAASASGTRATRSATYLGHDRGAAPIAASARARPARGAGLRTRSHRARRQARLPAHAAARCTRSSRATRRSCRSRPRRWSPRSTRDAMMAEEAEHYPGVRVRVEPRLPGAGAQVRARRRTARRRSTGARGSSWTTASGAASRGTSASRGCSDGRRSPTCPSGARSTRTRAAIARRSTCATLFAADPERGDRMHVEVAGWYFDYAKHRVTDETIALLVRARRRARPARAHRRDVPRRARQRHRGPAGAARRAAHAARTRRSSSTVSTSSPRCTRCSTGWARSPTQVRSGAWTRAHRPPHPHRREHRHRRQRPRSGDGVRRAPRVQRPPSSSAASCRTSTAPISRRTLRGLDPAETLFVVSSKTFTTLETLTNARSARGWLRRRARRRRGREALRRGVDERGRRSRSSASTPTNMFEFWDWVGGRYSMWSAIGLSLMVAIGPDHFAELLAGAHEMDEHFRTAPWPRTCRRSMGLLALLVPRLPRRADAGGRAVRARARQAAVVPPAARDGEQRQVGRRRRARRCRCRPARSCGARPARTASTRTSSCCTRAPRSCRSTSSGSCTPQPGLDARAGTSTCCVANLLAQAEALAFGTGDRRRSSRTGACRATVRRRCSSPTGSTPRTLGALVAAYEHKVLTLGTIWGIDSFDQWGVELGKKLAGRIAAELERGDDAARARQLDERAARARYASSESASVGLSSDRPRRRTSHGAAACALLGRELGLDDLVALAERRDERLDHRGGRAARAARRPGRGSRRRRSRCRTRPRDAAPASAR